MRKEFIPYNEAVTLRTIGFNEKCIAHYNSANALNFDVLGYRQNSDIYFRHNDKKVTAPLWQQAFKFFRDKFDLCHCIESPVMDDDGKSLYAAYINADIEVISNTDIGWIKTYEDAQYNCLRKLIELSLEIILNNKQNKK